MRPHPLISFAALSPLTPAHALVEGVDLVILRHPTGEEVSVYYGRCLHRGGLLCDGHVRGDDLVCDLHNWDYRWATGVSAYDPNERLKKFDAWVAEGEVFIDADDVAQWAVDQPQPFNRDAYLGAYADTAHKNEEPDGGLIRQLATADPKNIGHGPVAAMGVAVESLPQWNDIQIVTAQLHRLPLLDDEPVGTEVVIGPRAKRPLTLAIPLLVSDISFGAISYEAKLALATGADRAGTGVCSGEGGASTKSGAPTAATFTSWRRRGSVIRWRRSKKPKRFTLKWGKAPRPASGGICRERR